MDSFAALSPNDRSDALQEAATRRGTTLAVVEKDFWVCWTLKHLFALARLGPAFIFKGGTSLSKVFGLISRFSEDIDLSLRRDYLGFEGERDVEAPGISGSERNRRVVKLRERYQECVRGELLPVFDRGGRATRRLGRERSVLSPTRLASPIFAATTGKCAICL
ncbi:MAG TPA: nucleotidyl transferase AbiEii/AbiGii toxin family protein [Armatimonadota bacterium]|nr:nucleotidyl transferase AbiEii/AbiGii toxin family protein [Armatimonadota bacterium]